MIYLFFGTFAISLAPIFVKASTLAPTVAGFYRCAFAVVFLLLYSRGIKRFSLDRRFLTFVLLAGTFFAADLFFWHRSIHMSGAGIATILANTQAVYVAILGYVFFRERLRPSFWLCLGGAFTGLLVLVEMRDAIKAVNEVLFYRGIFFGAATGVVYALYLASLKKVTVSSAALHSGARLALVMFVSAVLLGFAALGEGSFVWPIGKDLWLMIGLALVSQTIGWILITRGLKTVPLSIAGLILLMQPVMSAILGITLFGEPLNWMQALGGGIALAFIYLATQQRSG